MLARGARGRIVGITLASSFALAAIAQAGRPPHFDSGCGHTPPAAARAGVIDDTLLETSVCNDDPDSTPRDAYPARTLTNRAEALQLCDEQRRTRLDSSTLQRRDRYDPDISPTIFDDPISPTRPNPYLPLTVGSRWEYRAGAEGEVVDVLSETKLIAAIRCNVVRDLLSRNGSLTGAIDEWYAQAKSGATWYFGKEVKDPEVFDGDDAKRPELVSIDGPFKAGRSGGRPGIVLLASPQVGDVYASLGNAEDVTVVLSASYSYGNAGPELDELVPPELAALFCSAGDCVVTKNFSLLEPGIFARRYYARGLGLFLEVQPNEDKAIRLVGCNFDPRCALLAP